MPKLVVYEDKVVEIETLRNRVIRMLCARKIMWGGCPKTCSASAEAVGTFCVEVLEETDRDKDSIDLLRKTWADREMESMEGKK